MVTIVGAKPPDPPNNGHSAWYCRLFSFSAGAWRPLCAGPFGRRYFDDLSAGAFGSNHFGSSLRSEIKPFWFKQFWLKPFWLNPARNAHAPAGLRGVHACTNAAATATQLAAQCAAPAAAAAHAGRLHRHSRSPRLLNAELKKKKGLSQNACRECCHAVVIAVVLLLLAVLPCCGWCCKFAVVVVA